MSECLLRAKNDKNDKWQKMIRLKIPAQFRTIYWPAVWWNRERKNWKRDSVQAFIILICDCWYQQGAISELMEDGRRLLNSISMLLGPHAKADGQVCIVDNDISDNDLIWDIFTLYSENLFRVNASLYWLKVVLTKQNGVKNENSGPIVYTVHAVVGKWYSPERLWKTRVFHENFYPPIV